MKLKGRPMVPGIGSGEVLVTSRPISFWGGVDPATGQIIDPRHELFGQSITGRILAFPHGKGSSTTSLIILELLRVGRQPAGIINVRTEPILAAGPIVSRHFYGQSVPIVTLDEASFSRLITGQKARLDGREGTVEIEV